MRSSPHALPLLPAVLLALAAGCSREDEPATPWTSIRLLDRLPDARIESAFDPTAAPSLRPILPETRLADLPRTASVRSDGEWAGPYLLGRVPGAAPPSIRVTQVPWSGAFAARVRISIDGDPGPDEAWFAVAANRPLRPAALADREHLEPLLSRSAALVRLEPSGDGFRAGSVEADPRAEVLLVVALGAAHRVDDARVAIEPLDPTTAWFEATEGTALGAAVRRIRLDEVLRESLLLGAPGTARWRIRVPDAAPAFRAHVAAPLRAGRGPVSGRVTAVAGDERRTASVWIEGAAWHPLSLDLAPLAGRAIDLSVEIAGPAGTIGAIGRPEVVGAPRGPLPPDVILVSLDTVRADRTSLHGGPTATTPALARLAASSAVFDAAIAAASWTLPSHLSMFSGFHPDRHGVTRAFGRVGGDVPWLAEELRSAGYRTLAYAASGYVDPQFGFARGFERYGTRDPVNPPLEWAELVAAGRDRPLLERARRARAQRDELLERLRGPRDRPLFVFAHTYQPHDYRAPPDVLRAFGAAEEELDVLLRGVYRDGSPYLAAGERTPEELSTLRRRAEVMYDAALSIADAFVADLVAALEESGRLDRTILLITSDHGEELFDRGRFGHGKTLYEELVRVPLLIRVPGGEPRRIAEVVSHVDLAPTVRALLGLDRDGAPPTDGRDLTPLLSGGAIEPLAALARGGGRSGTAPVLRTLRGAGRKVIVTETGGEVERTELYDLIHDPAEETNLARKEDAALAPLLERLERRVAALRALAAASGEATPSDALRETLAELGYLGDD
ncbi:MAG: sulfatase [Planctomycetota bacterium JB042]